MRSQFMRQMIFLAFLLAIFPLTLFSQTKGGETKAVVEIRRVDGEFHNAFRMADTAALNLLLADDFIWTHSSGKIQTKAQLMDALKSAALKYESLEIDDVNIYFYGKAAVASGRSVRKYPNKDSFVIRYSVFYIRQSGKWKAVAFHTSILPKS